MNVPRANAFRRPPGTARAVRVTKRTERVWNEPRRHSLSAPVRGGAALESASGGVPENIAEFGNVGRREALFTLSLTARTPAGARAIAANGKVVDDIIRMIEDAPGDDYVTRNGLFVLWRINAHHDVDQERLLAVAREVLERERYDHYSTLFACQIVGSVYSWKLFDAQPCRKLVGLVRRVLSAFSDKDMVWRVASSALYVMSRGECGEFYDD